MPQAPDACYLLFAMVLAGGALDASPILAARHVLRTVLVLLTLGKGA